MSDAPYNPLDHLPSCSFEPALHRVFGQLQQHAAAGRKRFDPDGCLYCGGFCGKAPLCETCEARRVSLSAKFGTPVATVPVLESAADRAFSFTPLGALALAGARRDREPGDDDE